MAVLQAALRTAAPHLAAPLLEAITRSSPGTADLRIISDVLLAVEQLAVSNAEHVTGAAASSQHLGRAIDATMCNVAGEAVDEEEAQAAWRALKQLCWSKAPGAQTWAKWWLQRLLQAVLALAAKVSGWNLVGFDSRMMRML